MLPSAAWGLLLAVVVHAQLSSPISDNSHVSVAGNKFLARRADHELGHGSSPPGAVEDAPQGQCPFNVQLKWMAEATSSIYATPLITDLFADGYKDIVVPAFVHHLEVFQGDNGAQAAGFPAFHADKSHASPLMYDIDHDGVQDVLLAMHNGEVLFFQDSGAPLAAKLVVPKLPVKRDWYVGLAADHVDHSQPDVADDGGADRGDAFLGAVDLGDLQQHVADHHNAVLDAAQAPQRRPPPSRGAGGVREAVVAGGGAEGGAADGGQHSDGLGQGEQASAGAGAQQQGAGREARRQRRLLVDGAADAPPGVEVDPDGALSQEANEAVGSLDEDWDTGDGGAAAVYYHDDGEIDHLTTAQRLREEAGAQHFDRLDIDDDYYRPLDHYAEDGGWGEDEFGHRPAPPAPPDMVYIDAHILCTPAIADVDGDGNDDLVVAVSYLFDRTYYDSAEHRAELPLDLDMSMYLATGIVVFDLFTNAIKWSQHLDLTTDHVDYRAFMYSSPTVVDLDHDGRLDIIVATSVGFIYVLDHTGAPKPGWPVQMGEVQGQVAVADVNGDGRLELLALDTRGNAALFNATGALLWDVHVKSALSQAATFADINGDGRLEAVFGSGSGKVYALDAETGEAVPNFPFSTTGRVVAPVMVTRLVDGPAQQLVVMSFDGFLYVIDGIEACADVVDIGDTSYTAVLADDLDGDGQLDLLVSTMSGHLYAFGTPAEYHPLKAWTAQVLGGAGFVARHDWMGIYASEQTRVPKDMRGTTFPVEFHIIDRSESAVARLAGNASVGAEFKPPGSPYTVKVLLTSIDTASMNAGEQPVIGMTDTFHAPGKYTMYLPCPRSRATALVRLEMRDANGVVHVHEFAQSFHMHFDRLLKWLVAAPLLAMGLTLLVLQPDNTVVLPT